MFHKISPVLLILQVTLASPVLPARGRSPLAGCNAQLPPGDTARFVGISRSTQPPGALREWSDERGRLFYAESWSIGSDKYLWDGNIATAHDGPTACTARRLRNDTVASTESAQLVNDSMVVVRDAKRTATKLARGVVPIPGFASAPVRMALLECAFSRPNHELETSRFGRMRAEEVAATTLRTGPRSEHVRLVLLRTSSDEVAARAWLDDSGRVVAYPAAEGAMDLVRPEWAGSRDKLLDAELHASSPNCHFGGGPGGCEPSTPVCNLPTSTATPAQRARAVTLSDSGYSIRSDGRGPYIGDSANVRLPWVRVVAGLELRPPLRGETARYFVIDLEHPVPGDIGKALGVVRVDGSFPGRFLPAGASTGDELLAHANTDWDFQQHSLVEIPVGGSIAVAQIDMDFCIDGALHVLQMGPQPYGHCLSAGTAIYGDGTTTGTVSHPDANQWIVDLPPGSIGRLFENRTGDPNAVNRGLYYVSLHLVVQK